MKTMRRMITDLPFDVLKFVMILMVKSSDGAATLARAISVCSVFMKIGEDEDVLKAVYFQNVNVWNHYALFQQANGLLHRCAKVGNEAAQYLLAKLLAKIKERERIQTFGGRSIADETHRAKLARAATFMAHFVPNQTCSSTKASPQTLLHWELVRKFLCHCTAVDFTDMHPLLNCYIDYFTKRATRGNLIMHLFVNKMCESGFRLRSSQGLNLEEMRAKLREQMQLMLEKRSRQSNQGLIREGKLESTVVEDSHKRSKELCLLREQKLQPIRAANAVENFVEMSQEEWCMCPNFAPMFRVGNFRRDRWDLVSMFEESRINALVFFDHLFP